MPVKSWEILVRKMRTQSWFCTAEMREEARRKARLKRVRAQPIWMRHRPRFFRVPGAMVDIGLGPTNGSE